MIKLSEGKIVKIFQKQFDKKNFLADDVEFCELDGTIFVAKVDTLVESTDIPPNTRIENVARKSIVSCVSDFVAKGVRPNFGMVSLTIPRSFSISRVEKLAKSMGKATAEFGIKMLGGDTNEGKELVLQVSLFGKTDRIIRRKGAKYGDMIWVTGPFGYTKVGLQIILENKKSNSRFLKKATNSILKPEVRMNFGIKNRCYFSSSMDSSDGLSTTLHEMANQSKRRFVITKVPANKDLIAFAKKKGLDLMDLVFNGGEEYEIVFTSAPKYQNLLKKSAKSLKIPLFKIGYVAKGSGIIYHKNGKKINIMDKGWRHFRN